VCHQVRCALLLRRVGHELTVADGRQVSDENTKIEAQENWEVIVIVAILVAATEFHLKGAEGGTSVGALPNSTQPREELLIINRGIIAYILDYLGFSKGKGI
jgi:hypothetical protein